MSTLAKIREKENSKSEWNANRGGWLFSLGLIKPVSDRSARYESSKAPTLPFLRVSSHYYYNPNTNPILTSILTSTSISTMPV